MIKEDIIHVHMHIHLSLHKHIADIYVQFKRPTVLAVYITLYIYINTLDNGEKIAGTRCAAWARKEPK
jgi:hypothetical protein